jgi:GrpB-like predicted nucleotidyltransferase (UPF0157 family)
MPRRIEITAYDPTWASLYAAERPRLAAALAPIWVEAHHVGSTSVAGLAAKPVIDILIEISDDSRLGQFDSKLVELGYTVRGECLNAGGTPGRFYYSKNTGGHRSHQLHICQSGHGEISTMLAFPRYLRQHPQIRDAYQALKKEAAAQNRHNIVGYIAAKNDFIRTTTAKALTR